MPYARKAKAVYVLAKVGKGTAKTYRRKGSSKSKLRNKLPTRKGIPSAYPQQRYRRYRRS